MLNTCFLHKGSKVEVSTDTIPTFTILGHVESVRQTTGQFADIKIRGRHVAGADKGLPGEIVIEGVKTNHKTAAVPVFQRFQASPVLSFPISVTKVSV